MSHSRSNSVERTKKVSKTDRSDKSTKTHKKNNSEGDLSEVAETLDAAVEEIDLYETKLDIQCKLHVPEDPVGFHLELYGKHVDHSVVNAVRRAIMSYVPIYGFPKKLIKFTRHSTMYNHDKLAGHIEMIPIYDVDNDFDLDKEIFMTEQILDDLFGTFTKKNYILEELVEEKTDKPLKKIEISTETKNSTDKPFFFSTHDLVLKIDNKVSNIYKKRDPVDLFALRPGEDIVFQAEAVLGIESFHSIFEATTPVYYEEDNRHYHLKFDTLEQLEPMRIFEKACVILTKKLDHLKSFINQTYKTEPNTTDVLIDLYGEDDTLGNLLATALQRSSYTTLAFYNIPHPLTKQVIIEYKVAANSKIKPIELFVTCIDYCKKVIETILKKARK